MAFGCNANGGNGNGSCNDRSRQRTGRTKVWFAWLLYGFLPVFHPGMQPGRGWIHGNHRLFREFMIKFESCLLTFSMACDIVFMLMYKVFFFVQKIVARCIARTERRCTTMRTRITLACSKCKQRNYNTMKNKKNDPDRLEMNKYCRFCREHTLHKETK